MAHDDEDENLSAEPEDVAEPEELAQPEEVAEPEELAEPEEVTEPEEFAQPEGSEESAEAESAAASPRRAKALIGATALATVLVVAAVAATAGGGSQKPTAKSGAPAVGLAALPGEAVTAPSTSASEPWVWQTSQSAANTTGPSGATPGAANVPLAATAPGAGPGAPTSTVANTAPSASAATGPGASSRGPSTPPGNSAPGSVPPSSAPAPSTPAAPPPTSAPPVRTVDLLTGPGCPSPAGGGYQDYGGGSSSDWGYHSSGGWTGDGCSGASQSMPMTGDDTNGPNRALWWFGSGTAGFSSCTVSVYVPWDGKATDTGGTAAAYQIVDNANDAVFTTFTVNQNTTHGQWVRLGTVAIGGVPVKIRLVDHGIDYPNNWRYGVAAARLHCTG